MSILGNIIWFLFGGFLLAISWYFIGILWCITIIGIPIGTQCFKFGTLMLWPFGKQIVYSTSTVSFLVNVLWLLFGGFALVIETIGCGIILYVTIIGIPFGLQCFKFAKIALMPFGARIV